MPIDDMSMPVNPGGAQGKCTVCTGSWCDNIWVENGKCTLDNLTYDQVWFILSKNPKAKRDLLKITSDPTLIELANTTNLFVDELEDAKIPEKLINKNTLPLYSPVFMGSLERSYKH